MHEVNTASVVVLTEVETDSRTHENTWHFNVRSNFAVKLNQNPPVSRKIKLEKQKSIPKIKLIGNLDCSKTRSDLEVAGLPFGKGVLKSCLASLQDAILMNTGLEYSRSDLV